MTIDAHGCGAGTKDFPRPNIVRLIVGEGRAIVDSSAEQTQTLTVLSTNIDDMNPEWLPPLLEQLMRAGALDAWMTPILMKKGRPAHTLSVLCEAGAADRLRSSIYKHSTSLGIRQTQVARFSVAREIARVATRWGDVAVKVATLPGGEQRATPEFADCKQISEQHDVPIAAVYEAATVAWNVRERDEAARRG